MLIHLFVKFNNFCSFYIFEHIVECKQLLIKAIKTLKFPEELLTRAQCPSRYCS